MMFALLVALSVGPGMSGKDPLLQRISAYRVKADAVVARLSKLKPAENKKEYESLKIELFFLQDRINDLLYLQRERRAGRVTDAEARDRLLKDALDLPM